MSDIIIISGEKGSGKTYKMISYAVESCIVCNKNVFIIASNPRSLDYFEDIIRKVYPSLRFERRKDGFLFETPTYSWFIHCVPFYDVYKYYYELDNADEIMIDEYPTLTYLVGTKNVVDCLQKAPSVIITISDYYLKSAKDGVIDIIKNLGKCIIIKRVENG